MELSNFAEKQTALPQRRLITIPRRRPILKLLARVSKPSTLEGHGSLMLRDVSNLTEILEEKARVVRT